MLYLVLALMVGLFSLLVATDHMRILQRLHQDEKMVEKINRGFRVIVWGPCHYESCVVGVKSPTVTKS